jgi:uncharacterized protein YkwD
MISAAAHKCRPGALAAFASASSLALLAALVASPGAAPAMAKNGCPEAQTPAAELPVKTLRKSIVCLINKQRGKADLKRLHRNRELRKVGQRHVELMVEEDCLGHECPGEATLETRIRQSGYLDGASHWKFAENTGCSISTKAMLRHWLRSGFHRQNMLEPKFRDVGVGVAQGAPDSGGCKTDFATFTVVFGAREF